MKRILFITVVLLNIFNLIYAISFLETNDFPCNKKFGFKVNKKSIKKHKKTTDENKKYDIVINIENKNDDVKEKNRIDIKLDNIIFENFIYENTLYLNCKISNHKSITFLLTNQQRK